MDEKQVCKNCKFYIQHYGLNSKGLYTVYCGHCSVYPPKKKEPCKKACDRFEPGTPDKDAFATKEYLAKELLKYVLNLPLLPEIEERER